LPNRESAIQNRCLRSQPQGIQRQENSRGLRHHILAEVENDVGIVGHAEFSKNFNQVRHGRKLEGEIHGAPREARIRVFQVKRAGDVTLDVFGLLPD